MEHATQVELVHQIFQYLDNKTTAMADDIYRNDVSGYTCEKRLIDEKEKLFRKYPLLMGLSCDIPNPGDYTTDDFSGVPTVIIRAKNGKLNGFLNVCRHRGSRVAEGCGSGKKIFQCPYHGWTYDQEGRLTAIPYDDGFEKVDREQYGLRRLPVVEQDGMIWLKTSPGEKMDIENHLEGLVPEFKAYRLDSYHHYETRILQIRMNWKLVVDTFLESYHLGVLHKNTVSKLLLTNISTFDSFGKQQRTIYARRTFDELRETPEKDWDLIPYTAIVYVLFPNTVFIVQKDHVETWRIFPKDDNPDQSQMYISLYTPEKATTEEARKHWDANMDLLLDTVEKEDFPLGENIQRGFYSNAQEYITFGRNEPSLAHYHASIDQALGIL